MAKRKKINDYLLFKRNQFLRELATEGKWTDQELGDLFGLTRQAINGITKINEKTT